MAEAPAKKPAPKPPAAKGPQSLTVVESARQLSILRFSPCGKLLVGAGLGPQVYRWKLTETAPPSGPSDLDAALDGKKKTPAAAPQGKLELTAMPPLDGHRGWITGLAVSATGERLFTVDSWGKLIARSYVDEKSPPLWSVEKAHEGWCRQVAVSPDGKTLATCGADGFVKLWSAADGKPLQSWNDHKGDVYSVEFHPDGKSLVSGDIYGKIIHWDLATAKASRRFEAEILYLADDDTLQDVGGVRRLVFDPAAKTLAACGAKPSGGGFVVATPVVRFFDWKTGKTIETREFGDSKAGFVHDAVYHPDGYLIGTTSGQPGMGQFFLWRPGEEKPFFVYGKVANVQTVTLHPDHVRIAIVATNGDSGGNGRRMKSDEEYHGNRSPISVWDLKQIQA